MTKAARAKNNVSAAAGNQTWSADPYVTFWGVRGTLPSPGSGFLKYGGNTSCVEVSFQLPRSPATLVFDAGTGIARLGDRALARGEREFHIFLSHMHYDHIMGLTCFAPLFREDCSITFYGQAKLGMTLEMILRAFFSHPFFPVCYDALPSKPRLNFCEINNLKSVTLGSLQVSVQDLSHPQNAVAYRVSGRDFSTSVVYATDHEHGTELDAQLENFAQECTLFLFDSTYSELTYQNHIGWGHSTAAKGAKIARNAEVSAYGIFHHAPGATDGELERFVLPEAVKIFKRSFLCEETQKLSLGRLAESDAPVHELFESPDGLVAPATATVG